MSGKASSSSTMVAGSVGHCPAMARPTPATSRCGSRGSTLSSRPSAHSFLRGCCWYRNIIARRRRGLPALNCQIFESELTTVTGQLRRIAPAWICFEHGSTRNSGLTGCCVDHFHFHLVPLDLDLASLLSARLGVPANRLDSLGQLAELRSCGDLGYFMVRNPNGTCYLLKAPSVSSQYIRQVLAVHLDRRDSWDWRSHPLEREAEQTVARFRIAARHQGQGRP